MKIPFIFMVFLILFILFLTSQCVNITTNTVQSRNFSPWSTWIQAQDIGNMPANYFICKVSLRESKWSVRLKNCNCRRNPSRCRSCPNFICDWCWNDMWTKTDAVKITYCSTQDWSKQIEKVFESGKPASGNWRQVKCPQNQYVNKMAVRFGWQYDTDTGLVSVEMKCETLDLKANSYNWDGNAHYRQFQMSPFPQNPRQQFLSALKVRFDSDGKLSGLDMGYERITKVNSITFEYEKVQIYEPTQTVIETLITTNQNTKQVVSRLNFSKNFTTVNRWQLQNPAFAEYEIKENACASPLPYMLESLDSPTKSLYTASIQKFGFNKDLIATYKPTQELVIVVGSGKQATIQSIVREQKVSLPFKATLIVANDQEVLKTIVIKGVWKGVMTLPVEVVVTESDITPKPQQNLTKQNVVSNGNKI